MRRLPCVRMRVASLTGSILCAIAYLFCTGTAAAFQLITKEEAALPDDPTGLRRGGLTRGPEILFISPAANAGLVKTPIDLNIRFKAHGGAMIAWNRVLITYKKIPPIDMTQRLRPFIRADGIEIPAVEMPPGAHRIEIEVQDSDGRLTTNHLVITVAK